MMSQSEHEASLINAFIVSQKRGRMLSLLANPKRRRKVLNELYHFDGLDERFLMAIPSSDQTPVEIAKSLRRLGAPDRCWVISTNSSLDGREMLLDEALSTIVGAQEGNLLSCIPGRLGFFEGEGPSDRWILRKPA